MADIQVTITNLAEIKAAFAKAPIKMAENLQKAIERSVFLIEGDSMRNTPVQTGRLRASHVPSFQPMRGLIEVTADYAVFVHDGTRYMPSRPFLLNAVEQHNNDVQDYFNKAVQDTLDGIGESI